MLARIFLVECGIIFFHLIAGDEHFHFCAFIGFAQSGFHIAFECFDCDRGEGDVGKTLREVYLNGVGFLRQRFYCHFANAHVGGHLCVNDLLHFLKIYIRKLGSNRAHTKHYGGNSC